MKKIGFVLFALMIFLPIHLVVIRYISFFGVQPDILFLFVIASGFLFGGLMGESIGFIFGLVADSMGIHLFGFYAFLFSLTGYLSGKLRRRVDSERPIPQVVIALLGTMGFCFLAAVLKHFLETAGVRASFGAYLFLALMNSILMPCVFWFCSWWAMIWKIERS